MDLLFSLSASLLRVGQSIPWDVYDPQGVLLLKQGSILLSERQIEQIVSRGASTKMPVREPPPETPQERERRLHPFLSWHEVESELANIYTITDPDEFPVAARSMVKRLIEMVQHNPNGSLAAMLLNRHHRYPVSHALHVALICVIVGGKLAMDIEALVAAALTMNISMMDLQSVLFRQEKPLSPEQAQIVRKHPTESANMLVHRGIMDPMWLRLVAEHHEPDYPTGNPGHQDSMLIHVCDIYTAKFSGRSYRQGISPEEAILSTLRPFKDQKAMHKLLQTIGLFPPGLFVKLIDGSLAIVLRVTDEFSTPHVALVVDRSGVVLDGKKRMNITKDKILSVIPRSKVAANFPFAELYNDLVKT